MNSDAVRRACKSPTREYKAASLVSRLRTVTLVILSSEFISSNRTRVSIDVLMSGFQHGRRKRRRTVSQRERQANVVTCACGNNGTANRANDFHIHTSNITAVFYFVKARMARRLASSNPSTDSIVAPLMRIS